MGCDCKGSKIHRRQFLRLGMAGVLGYSLGPLRAAQKPRAGSARSIILIYLNGGPSHLDTFDPKPKTREGGPFRAIQTSIPGVSFTEHLPGLAERAKQLSVIRTLHSREGSHGRARYLMHTAYSPVPGTRHPSLGSSVGHEIGDEEHDLPSYICLGGPGEGAGFFGPAYAPFVVRSKPGKHVENLAPFRGVDDRRLDGRLDLMEGFDTDFKGRGGAIEVEAHQAMMSKAKKMMRSPLARSFRVDEESPKLQDSYGDSDFGKRCLIARRLVEGGVPAVEVELPGWDTHQDNFTGHENLMKQLDPGVSGLIDDLIERELFEKTILLVVGEFGRTPRINPREGRDHHPRCFSALLAGGGLRRGQVVGSTSPKGDRIADRPVSIPDLFATLLARLGVDGERDYMAGDRPITLANSGTPLPELI